MEATAFLAATAKAQEEKVADRMASDARPPLNRFAKLAKVPDLAPGSVMDPAMIRHYASEIFRLFLRVPGYSPVI